MTMDDTVPEETKEAVRRVLDTYLGDVPKACQLAKSYATVPRGTRI